MHHFDEQTVQEQKAWEHYAAIESENHHLKMQLKKAHRIIRKQRKREQARIDKEKRNRKQRFRNNGKAGK